MRHLTLAIAVVTLAAAGAGCSRAGGQMAFSEWQTLFDGKSLAGWHISDSSHHGNTQGWCVEDGAIVGAQDKPGNGGILLSDHTYANFLLELELNPDWGLDSGLFLRSTPDGRCYQLMVDCYDGGNVGGVYGEGLGGFRADAIDWLKHFRKGEWNTLLVVVTGNPPIIEVWLNGEHVVSWKGEDRLLDSRGHIALQVHAGDGFFGKKTRFRNIRIRPIP